MTSEGSRARTRRVMWLALTTVYLVWGSTYLAIRVMVRTVPPLLGAGIRFVLAAILVSGWIMAREGVRSMRASRPQLLGAGVIGVLILFGGIGLLTIAEQEVDSGFAALVIASVPLWVVLLRLLHRERVSLVTLLSTVAGLAAIAGLVGPTLGAGIGTVRAVAALLVASLLTAVGSFFSKRMAMPERTIVATAMQMLIAGIVMVVAAVAIGELADLRLQTLSTASIAALAYLILAGSVVAYTAFVWLLEHVPVSLVATYAYVNPVVAVALGWLVLGETMSLRATLSALVIVTCVAVVVVAEARERSQSH